MDESEHDGVEAYVLGALDGPDRNAFERHLETCPSCRAEIATYRPVIDAMRAVALPPAAPPEHAPIAAARPRRDVRSGVVRYGIAAALLLALGGFGGAAIERALGSDMVTVAEMTVRSAQDVSLNGTAASGIAIVGEARKRTAFVVRGLPAPATDRAYQVWVRGSSTSSPGLLHYAIRGFWILVVPGDALRDARTISVTVEPSGGSPRITSAPVVTGDATNT